ncbi:outer membrane lipoprotein-sorting protein [bacterium]|nr:outer membrane lipoprotein-sorting protein [bacterium]
MNLKKPVLFVSLLSLACTARDLTGPQIIQKVNDLMNPESMWAAAKMVIQTTSGQERTFTYESWSGNHGEKNLIRYKEPARVRGQATLLLDYADNIWMYFPRTQRVRKLATHAKKQKMEGSDFSYEDMGAGNAFIDDFESVRLDDEELDGQRCFQIEMTRKKDSDISYSKMIMFVRQDNFVPVRIVYYDENHPDELLKTLTQSDIRDIQGIPTAMKITMQSESDKSETRMELLEVKYNPELDPVLFTERGLKQ